MYALIQNNVVVQYPIAVSDWRAAHPDISLPYDPTEAQLNEQGIYTVYPTPKPSYDWITQTCTETTPHKQGSQWFQTWSVTQNSQQQIDANEAIAKQQNKDKASQLLQETDWTATVDINNPQYSNPFLGNQDAFLSYRSQVRQIAVNPPVTVSSWPTKPAEVWVDVPSA